jgi:hypothetical protein
VRRLISTREVKLVDELIYNERGNEVLLVKYLGSRLLSLKMELYWRISKRDFTGCSEFGFRP